jgi:hypothetical protein
MMETFKYWAGLIVLVLASWALVILAVIGGMTLYQRFAPIEYVPEKVSKVECTWKQHHETHVFPCTVTAVNEAKIDL